MQDHIEHFRAGFPQGFTAVTTVTEPSGIAFGVLKLAAGEVWKTVQEGETAFLLMAGDVEAMASGIERRMSRQSLFDEGPSAPHVAAGEEGGLRGARGKRCSWGGQRRANLPSMQSATGSRSPAASTGPRTCPTSIAARDRLAT